MDRWTSQPDAEGPACLSPGDYGGETDVCVLATVLGAIDLGYATTVLRDAVCSGVDETHDACLKLLGDRFSVQLKIQYTEEFLRHG